MLHAFLLAFLICQAVGCSDACSLAPFRISRPYAIGFVNATGVTLDDVRFESAGEKRRVVAIGGFMVRGAQASAYGQPDPIPNDGTVSWTAPDGKKHQQVVRVASRILGAPRFAGTIWLKIMPEGVLVVPLTDDEMLKQGKEP